MRIEGVGRRLCILADGQGRTDNSRLNKEGSSRLYVFIGTVGSIRAIMRGPPDKLWIVAIDDAETCFNYSGTGPVDGGSEWVGNEIPSLVGVSAAEIDGDVHRVATLIQGPGRDHGHAVGSRHRSGTGCRTCGTEQPGHDTGQWKDVV